MLQIVLENLAVIAGLMTVVWLISLPLRDVSIVDMFWGTGFVIVAWVTLLPTGEWNAGRILLVTMVTLWGIRLSGFLTWRNWGEPEDYRYRAFREKYGRRFPIVSLFLVFLLQGLLIVVVSLPVQAALIQQGVDADLQWLSGIGVVLWIVGLLFESIGDFQLARFKADPSNAGKVLDRGLWRFTRHPNYFGDFLVWWGLSVTAFSLGAAWWTIIGPIVMTLLLTRVSGVTLLETAQRQRKPEYEAYRQRTNAFFPWFPRAE